MSEDVLSPSLRSAGIITLFFSVTDKSFVPKWAEIVADRVRATAVTPTIDSGPKSYLVLEGKKLQVKDLFQGIVSSGFEPIHLTAVERSTGIRMSLLYFRSDLVTPEEPRISVEQLAEFEESMSNLLWDMRVHRNPGKAGGNFSVTSGNPSFLKRGAKGILRVDEVEGFEIVENENLIAAKKLSREIDTIKKGFRELEEMRSR